MLRTKLISSAIATLLGVTIATAQWGSAPGAITEGGENSQIDYSAREIKATGIGAVPANAPNVGAARASAIRAAKMDALRNLVEAVKDVRISSETTVENNMVANDVVKSKVEATVRGAQQEGDVRYLSDSSVEITMKVALSGIMDVVMPITATAPSGPLSIDAVPDAGTVPSISVATPGQPVTGLIIDARGLGIKPSMSPQILANDGTVLYGPGSYPREFAVQHGVVGYHKDIAAAQGDPRVVGNPLTVKAVATSGTLATDVVISKADSQQAIGMNGFADAIGACRVMFILD